MMARPILFSLLAFLLASSAVGQTASVRALQLDRAHEHQIDRLDRSATLELLQREDSKRAIEAFQEQKRLGLLPIAGKHASATVGSAEQFNVWNFETNEYESRAFTLELADERFNIWVETAALDDGTITTDQIETLGEGLAVSTPERSVDPSRGIIANDEIIFGDPPNVDGDSKTDVLFVDVRDGYEAGGGFTAGYVDPRDIGPPNSRDVLYLDIEPTVRLLGINEALATAAHEYQHLIMLNYDRFEELFINEGLSTWAEAVNGFQPASPSHLGSVSELRRPLLSWRDGGGTNINDYRRSGLFTAYLAERMGVELTGSITRQSIRGGNGYQRVLNNLDLDLEEVVASYHIANFLDRPDLEARFGYDSPFYQGVSAASEVTYDGSLATETSLSTPSPISPGATAYFTWESVADIAIGVDVSSDQSSPNVARDRIRPHVILEYEDGTVHVESTPPGPDEWAFSGTFRRVTLAVPHVAIDLNDQVSNRVSVTYYARWSAANPEFETVDIAYDDGLVYVTDPSGPTVQAYFFEPGGGNFEEDARAANRFDVESGALIESVSVAPLFGDDFGGPDGTRDYRLVMWADDGNGAPGDEIFSLDRIDGRPGSITTSGSDFAYLFDEIDLAPYRDQIGPLTGPIYISFENAGTDANYVVAPLSEYLDADNPSWFYMTIAANKTWRSLPSLQTQGGEFPFRERVVPIRASFLTPLNPTDTANEVEVPRTVSLEANYPNPFNPETTIAFSLDRAQQVRLSVFDITGREVAVLADGLLPAGRHENRFEGSALASGLYLYRLQTASSTFARPMVLLK